MPDPEPTPRPARPSPVTGVSMRDLLASCAAAEAVSTPPRLPDAATVKGAPAQHRRAA
ncbi:hypothetical protein KMT30_27045 [Streptomyces sp. IBSBF 2953]|uniref:hypothetical protein n=1 Tax=Streptomyces TaxID=1883 RepID=UPI00211A900D|nr:hypothetical protein [Streptomyces scabiei]MCQ9182635.1 hypothetical protein [Streptomyces hayashii]MDX3114427.1 hypothetical protein [Streptomyces scabiei]